MNLKVTKKLASLNVKKDQVVKPEQCANVKGGGYWCCIRNKWIR